MKARLVVLCVLVLGTVLLLTLPQAPAPVAAQGPSGSGPTIGHAVATGVSPALRGLPANPSRQGPQRVVPLRRAVNPQSTLKLPSRTTRDPVVQTAPGRTTISPPIQNFEGTYDFNNYYPPDTNGDIGYDPATGKKYYVQWVNVGYQVWDVTSTPTSLTGPVDASLLWASLPGSTPCKTLTSFSSNGGDVIVLFDSLAQRWLASAFANNTGGPYHQCIALSKTGDPTGQYWLYDFIVSITMFNDYPKWAVWPDGYYLTVNQIGGTNGVGAFVFDRSKMLSGDPSASFQYFNLPSQNNMLPSNLELPAWPPTGSPNYFVQLGYDTTTGNPTNTLQIWQFHTDWSITSNTSFTLLATLPTAPFDANLCNFSMSCIPQPVVAGQTVQTLDALSDRLMYRLQYLNFGSYETMVVNHTVAVGDFPDHAGVRWYELRKSGGVWSIYQQGTYAPDTDYRWMGSIAVDSEGNIALGYSVSSGTVFPSIRYTGRLVTDPLNQLPQGEGTIMAGAGSQTFNNRWGDYTSMSVDPLDGCTFWYTNEYYSTTSASANWQTRIGSFRLCTGTRPVRIYYFPVVLKNANP